MIKLSEIVKYITFVKESSFGSVRKTMKYKGAEIDFEMAVKSPSRHEYKAFLKKGNWPSDEDLITLADGDIPPSSHHFGGSVQQLRDPSQKYVRVWVD